MPQTKAQIYADFLLKLTRLPFILFKKKICGHLRFSLRHLRALLHKNNLPPVKTCMDAYGNFERQLSFL